MKHRSPLPNEKAIYLATSQGSNIWEINFWACVCTEQMLIAHVVQRGHQMTTKSRKFDYLFASDSSRNVSRQFLLRFVRTEAHRSASNGS